MDHFVAVLIEHDSEYSSIDGTFHYVLRIFLGIVHRISDLRLRHAGQRYRISPRRLQLDVLHEKARPIQALRANHGVRLPRRYTCLLYTSPSPRDGLLSRMPSSA